LIRELSKSQNQSEVTVIYFYAPFAGVILNRVLDNIRDSLMLAPRKLTIVCKNPYYFEKELHRHNMSIFGGYLISLFIMA